MPSYTLRANGKSHSVEAEADMPLLWVLRDLIGLTGTKYGCGIGSCGSCTVHMLVSAAAKRWGVDASACRTETGFVHGPKRSETRLWRTCE